MKKNRVLYGLLAIVLTALIVLAGTWIPEAMLVKKAEILSSGKTAEVDNKEITPYTYTMSAWTRIPKLTEVLHNLMEMEGIEAGQGVREPLDTELTVEQAREKAADFLYILNDRYERWGLTPLTVISDREYAMDSYAVNEKSAAEAAAGKESEIEMIVNSIEASFIVDPENQQLSLWWLNSVDGNLYLALDAVTGLPVQIWYIDGAAAADPVESALAVCQAYEKVYGSDYGFAEPVEKSTQSMGNGGNVSNYICTGKNLNLRCQYYFYSNELYGYYDKMSDFGNNNVSCEVKIWLDAS